MLFDLVITFFLVFLNGFFVAAEFAIVKVRISQLEMKVKEGQRSAILSKHILNHLDGYLAATQLGITLASLGLGWIGEPVVSKLIIKLMIFFGFEANEELAHQIALPVAFALITILHIVFGELTPKSLAIQKPESTTLIVAYPLQFFYRIFQPFIWLLNGIANLILKALGISIVHGSEVHSSEELKYLVEQGQENGEIDPAEYKIIRNAFNFSEQTVKQIMVPRVNVFALNLNDFNDEKINGLIDESYSRIPCYEGGLDGITGIIYLKDILIASREKSPINIKNLIRPVMMVPDSKHVGELLSELQSKHQQMAIVVNEYGGTEGLITMEDILEELVGEIQDESDNEIPIVEVLDDNTFNVFASSSIDDINEYLPHPIEKEDQFETLAGYLNLKFGKIPSEKEKITIDNFEFTILKRTKNKIVMVKVVNLYKEIED